MHTASGFRGRLCLKISVKTGRQPVRQKGKCMEKKISQSSGKKGFKRSGLRLFGMILIALGLMGRGILENRVLGVSFGTNEQLLEALNMSGGMTAAAAALVMEALESCAVPIFAVLTIDGFVKTSDFKSYLFRVLALALVSEIPYNYAVSVKLIDAGSRNPVFALVLSLVMLYLYRYYEGTSFTKILAKTAVGLAALIWALIFNVKFGVLMLLIVDVLWAFRDRPALKNFLGAAVAVCCCVGNPLYMFAPFGFLAAHYYNGEEGFAIRKIQYATYPILLLAVGFAGYLLFY